MGKNHQTFREGDIFAVPLPIGGYLFGRILLNIERIRALRILPIGSPLLSLGNPMLIEMYSEITTTLTPVLSEVLIPCAYLQTDALGTSWTILENSTVAAESIEFPEVLVGFKHQQGDARFEKGEIQIPIPITHYDRDLVDVFLTAHSSYYWPAVCMRQLGMAADIPKAFEDAELLSQCDLRFSPHREYIYSMLPIDMNQSYYEQQAQMGFDIGRLYT